ncbi:DUF551 domain-containing protein [Salmonella enterica]|nr:DUF551 domain-containing protein [Salmonella enterica]
MTTITKEWLQQTIAEFENTRDDIPFGLDDDDAKILIVLKRALASLEAEPVGEVSEKRHGLVMDGTVDLGGKSTYRIIKGEKAMKRLPLGTKFYIVPPAPVVPDDWVMVPKEPTQAMINAWLSEVANWRGHVAGYKAALAAAPKPQNVPQNIPENIPAGKSTLTPDGWISCSERMPEQGAYISAVSKHGEYVAGQVIDDWLDLHDGTSFGLGEVYLWMMLPPLPAPPQH